MWKVSKGSWFFSFAAAEQEEAELEQTAREAATKLTKYALRATLSLREMIELGESLSPIAEHSVITAFIHISPSISTTVRSRSQTQLSSVQEVLDSTPESAAVIRRRNRKERKEVEAERLREESERALSTRYQHRRPYDRSTPSSRYA